MYTVRNQDETENYLVITDTNEVKYRNHEVEAMSLIDG